MTIIEGTKALHSFELWLDCRNSGSHSLTPLACDHRLVPQGGANRKHDLTCDGCRIFAAEGHLIGLLHSGTDEEVQRHALEAIGSAEWAILEASGCIPSQALIAASSRHGMRLAVVVSSELHLQELVPVLSSIGAIIIQDEVGDSVGVLWNKAVTVRMEFSRTEASLLETVCGGILLPATEELKGAIVTSINLVSDIADIVCLDFIQMLQEGEGALVGSSARALCFVHAETSSSLHRPSRPFRINAGPVHSYVALPDGRTKYLSDVVSGEQVLVVTAQSLGTRSSPSSRSVTVGRCHMERRPVFCIRLEFQGQSSQVFLENSSAVRVHAKSNHPDSVETFSAQRTSASPFFPLPITELRKGDEVLVHWVSGAGEACFES